jgi:ribonuclease VapC
VIVVETSALVAILLLEPDGQLYRSRVAAEQHAVLPVSCFVEAALALRKRAYGPEVLPAFLRSADIGILPSDERQARIAVAADRRYGRGTGHPARLNFGDCLAYAAAIAHDAPLLFKGDDFIHTDVRPAA